MTTEAPIVDEGLQNKSGVDYSKMERIPLDKFLESQNANPAGDGNDGANAGAENGEAGNTANAADGSNNTTELTDEQIISLLDKRGVKLSKIDEITSLFSERDTLKNEIETLSKKGPEFPNDKAKALYEFASKYDGNQMVAAKALLNAAEVDLQSADPKTVQFEAFALQNPQLSREEARAIFAEQYELDYGDGQFDGKALLKFKHDKATNEARQSIEAAVKQFKEAKSEPDPKGPTPEEIVAQEQLIKASISGALKDFKGISVELPEYKTKTGQVAPSRKIEVAIKPEEAAKFQGYLEKPESFIADMIGKHQGENGLNWNSYVSEMTQVVNRQQIYAEARSQGIEEGMLIILNEIKNSGGGKLPGDGAGAEAPKKSQSQQYQESRQRV